MSSPILYIARLSAVPVGVLLVGAACASTSLVAIGAIGLLALAIAMLAVARAMQLGVTRWDS